MQIHSRDTVLSAPIENIPMANGVAYKVGVLLTATGALATGTTVPVYICNQEATGVTGGTVAATRIQKDMVFEAVLSASGSSLSVGSKVQLHASDGNTISNNPSGGIFEIIAFLTAAKASGDSVLGRF